MAKVSTYTAATDVTDDDVFYVVDGTTSKRVTALVAHGYFAGDTITPGGTTLTDLEAAVTSASAGDTVRLTAGTTYQHNAVWAIAKDGITIDASGAIIEATVETASAVKIQGDNITWVGGTLTVTSTVRGNALEHHKLVLDSCSGARIYRPRIEDSHAAGIFCFGADDFTIVDPVVVGTRADGIHMASASHHGLVINPVCAYTGDDGVAVVSTDSDSGPCHHIDVVGARVHWQTGGRGLTVVGGEDVRYSGFEVVGSFGAGVLVAIESGFSARAVSRVRVEGGRLAWCNQDASLDHGSITVVSGRDGMVIDDVTFRAIEIVETRAAANGTVRTLQDGSTGTATNLTFEDIRVSGNNPGSFEWDELSATYTDVLFAPATSISNNQTASYTLALTDAGKTVEMDVASANTLTVPPNSSVAFPVGTVVGVEQHGAGVTTLTPGSGVTINSRGSLLDTAGQWAVASLRKTATDTWVATGDLA